METIFFFLKTFHSKLIESLGVELANGIVQDTIQLGYLFQ